MMDIPALIAVFFALVLVVRFAIAFIIRFNEREIIPRYNSWEPAPRPIRDTQDRIDQRCSVMEHECLEQYVSIFGCVWAGCRPCHPEIEQAEKAAIAAKRKAIEDKQNAAFDARQEEIFQSLGPRRIGDVYARSRALSPMERMKQAEQAMVQFGKQTEQIHKEIAAAMSIPLSTMIIPGPDYYEETK